MRVNSIPFELPGFRVTHVENRDEVLTVQAETSAAGACCPNCQTESRHLHSHYQRAPQDLPSSGKAVRLVLQVRRFRCRNAQCRRRVFCERVPAVVAYHAQRTVRLTTTLTDLGLALGGEAGARQSQRQAMSVSASTLLRLIRRYALPACSTPRVLGIDDFALRKRQT